jgi:hypothetical protein
MSNKLKVVKQVATDGAKLKNAIIKALPVNDPATYETAAPVQQALFEFAA